MTPHACLGQIEPLTRLVSRLLADDMGWVRRRVEDLYFDFRAGETRKVSLDIDMDDLRDRATAADWPGPTIPIPLGWMEKGLTTDLSVLLDGGPLSVWRRHRDSDMGCAAIVAALPDAVRELDLTPARIEGVHRICYAMPTSDDVAAVQAAQVPSLWRECLATGDLDWLLRCCDLYPGFSERLRLHTLNFMPIVELPRRYGEEDGRSPIVKFDILTGPVGWHAPVFQPFLTGPIPITVRIMRDLEAQSEHLHLHLPEGLEMAGLPWAQIAADPGQTPDEFDADEPVGSAASMCLIGWDSATVYRAQRIGAQDYALTFPLLPRLEGFATKALAALLATAVPILGLLLGCILGRGLPSLLGSLSEQTAAALILLGASLISGYAVSDARAMVLTSPSKVITAGVIAGIVASIWVLIGGTVLGGLDARWADAVILAAALLVELFAIACVSVAIRTSHRIRREVAGVRGRTMPLEVRPSVD